MIDPKLLKALTENQCVVSYEKIEGPETGQIRDMLCTLVPEHIPSHTQISQNSNSDHLLVWCIDRDNWRSVRANTIKGWKTV